MLSSRVNSQSGLEKELLDWWGRRTRPWHTPAVDPTVFLSLSVRYGSSTPTEGATTCWWLSPGYAHPGQEASTNNAAVLERMGCSLAGQSLQQCWGLFFCIPCSLSSRTRETALSFLLCASWTSLMFRAMLVTIKLIIVPSSVAHCRALPAVSDLFSLHPRL